TILGTGALGTALGVLLTRANWPLVGIASRDHSRALVASLRIGCPAFPDPLEPVRQSGIVLLTVSDDAVAEVARRVLPALREGALLVHTSGVHGPEVLNYPLGLAMHPLQSVPSPDAGIKRLPGSTFSLEGPSVTLERGRDLVRAVGGLPLVLPSGDRALYHAAAVLVSSSMVASLAMGLELWQHHGVGPESARDALLPLAEGTLANLHERLPSDALTGPAARGDQGTLLMHREALQRHYPEGLDFYRSLTRLTWRLSGKSEPNPLETVP
ncbi:MAG: Rossmann-like and DUF2520 domain-containing protein, partial [Candidatus Eremiobacterota bacterium]